MATKKYRLHKLKSHDTINSIALELGITPQELSGFHNVHCKNEDIIGVEFPKHLTELLVYPHIREIKKENYPTTQFVSGYTLRVKPKFSKENYGVTYTIIDNDEQNTLSYILSLEYQGKNSEGFSIYEINRLSQTFVNDEETDKLADNLAEKVAKVLYPLSIIVNEEGKWIMINNYEEILKRWVTVKEQILNEYEGDWVMDYLALNETVLNNESSLQTALSKDWFLCTFFNGIYVNYTRQLKFENNIFFPLIANTAPLKYKVEHTIDEYLDEYGQLIIEQNGILADERAKADIENGLTFPEYASSKQEVEGVKGNFRSKIFLNPENNTIKSVFLEGDVQLDKPKKVTVTISLV